MKGPTPSIPDATVRIDLPETLAGGGPVVFTPDYVEREETRLHYGDVTSVRYNLTGDFLRFAPAHEGLFYRVARADREILLVLRPRGAAAIRESLPAFGAVVDATKRMIEPVLVRRLARRVIEDGAALDLGNVRITRSGIEKQRYYAETSRVPWSEKAHPPEFSAGKIMLHRDRDGVPVVFGSIPLETDNAVILPELIRLIRLGVAGP